MIIKTPGVGAERAAGQHGRGAGRSACIKPRFKTLV